METRTQFFFLTGAAFIVSVLYLFIPVTMASYLFFFLFLFVGGYTIYVFLELEYKIPAETRPRYYELVERVIYMVLVLYFLLFTLSLEKIWAVTIVGRSVNAVFLAIESFLSVTIFLLGILHVSEQAGFAEDHFYQA